jgi:hypothetical protein
MMKAVLLVVLAAACGGKHKNDAEESGGGTIDTQATTGDPTDRSGNMVSPEKMDEIDHLLARKQMIVSRCLSTAVEAGEAPKGAKAKITLEISIAPSGQPTTVEVLKSSLDVKSVQGCVKKHVESITFPTLPRQYETSYTYAMEAN